MKWKAKPDPKRGDGRVVRRFFLLPELIGDTWHWLRFAWVREEYALGGQGLRWFIEREATAAEIQAVGKQGERKRHEQQTRIEETS
jgi:hypothetical protein